MEYHKRYTTLVRKSLYRTRSKAEEKKPSMMKRKIYSDRRKGGEKKEVGSTKKWIFSYSEIICQIGNNVIEDVVNKSFHSSLFLGNRKSLGSGKCLTLVIGVCKSSGSVTMTVTAVVMRKSGGEAGGEIGGEIGWQFGFVVWECGGDGDGVCMRVKGEGLGTGGEGEGEFWKCECTLGFGSGG